MTIREKYDKFFSRKVQIQKGDAFIKVVKKKVPGETPKERFKRLATIRTNEVLRRLKILGNCGNKYIYDYTEEDVEKIFSAIEKKLREVKSQFYFPKEKEEFRL